MRVTRRTHRVVGLVMLLPFCAWAVTGFFFFVKPGDAIATEHGRYGEIAAVERHAGDSPSASIETTTGVQIDLDWATLSLQQGGRDTRRIDALYRVHYLQWTGIQALDRVLGIVGLASLIALAFFGLRLAFAARTT